jgi:hypothetical protein
MVKAKNARAQPKKKQKKCRRGVNAADARLSASPQANGAKTERASASHFVGCT